MRIVLDNALAAYPVIWAAAGTPHAVFPTTFAELVALTGAETADIREVAPRVDPVLSGPRRDAGRWATERHRGVLCPLGRPRTVR